MTAFPGLIERDAWAKGRNIGRLGNPMQLPVKNIIFHHTVTSIGNDPISAMQTVNDIGKQRFGMHSYNWNMWPDYNGEKHRVLQGQGGRKGAHTSGWNDKALSICWIGNYERNVPGLPTLQVMPSMIEYSAAWIGYLIDNGVVDRSPVIWHHSELGSTACPGDEWLEGALDRVVLLVNQGFRLQDYGRAQLQVLSPLSRLYIAEAYANILGRKVSEEEIALWLATTASEDDLTWSLSHSEEYRNRSAKPPTDDLPDVSTPDKTAHVLALILERLDALESKNSLRCCMIQNQAAAHFSTIIPAELQQEIIELSANGKISPLGVMTLLTERGVPTGGLDRYDVADWLRNANEDEESNDDDTPDAGAKNEGGSGGSEEPPVAPPASK